MPLTDEERKARKRERDRRRYLANREAIREAQRRYYIENREAIRDYERRRRQRNKMLKDRVARFVGCRHCGTKDGELHYHHPDPRTKYRAVASLVLWRDKMKAEMRKCIVLCVDCHLQEHSHDGQLPEMQTLWQGSG